MDDVTVEKAAEENRYSMVDLAKDDTTGLVRRVCKLVAETTKPSAAQIIETLGVQRQKALRIIKDLIASEVLLRHGRGSAAYLSAGPKFREVVPD